MKKFYLLFIPFLIALLILPACDNDPDTPEEPQAKLKLELKLARHGAKQTSSVEDEVVYSMDYNMDQIQRLIYLVHNAENGQFLYSYNISQDDFRPFTTDGITTFESNLPFGQYYISIVAMTGDLHFNHDILDKLAVNYEKAAFQAPANSNIFYATSKVDCTPSGELSSQETIELSEKMELQELTGAFIFLLPKGSKGIPAEANFNIKMKVTDLPCAFFLKDGKTLNPQEEKELQIKRYNETTEITQPFEKQFTAKYHFLNNTELEDSEKGRGCLQITYKEDVESDIITNQINITFPECTVSPGPPSTVYTTVYMWELYSGISEVLIIP
ncbi:MAG: hypothetical protein LUD74_01215 [Tannerellaceae bacterium]|nr:hypothetical protein [Tannerellaceae bacterium]